MKKQNLSIGQKVEVNAVEGKTSKAGVKQNKVYTITGAKGVVKLENGKMADMTGFYEAVDKNGKEFVLCDVWDNLSSIGIRQKGFIRTTYTRDFNILD